MDAEIWSYADTRNGRLILRALTVLIILKEVLVMALPVLGLPVIDPVWSPTGGPDPLLQFRGPLMLLIKLLLVLFLHMGFSWARIGLGLTYLATSIYAGLSLMGLPELAAPGPLLTLINALLGVVIGSVLMLSAQLKAHLWRRAATRLTIPIPGDDEPADRPSRRTRSVGETIVSALRRLVSVLILIAVLGAIAHLYGWTQPLLDALRH